MTDLKYWVAFSMVCSSFSLLLTSFVRVLNVFMSPSTLSHTLWYLCQLLASLSIWWVLYSSMIFLMAVMITVAVMDTATDMTIVMITAIVIALLPMMRSRVNTKSINIQITLIIIVMKTLTCMVCSYMCLLMHLEVLVLSFLAFWLSILAGTLPIQSAHSWFPFSSSCQLFHLFNQVLWRF